MSIQKKNFTLKDWLQTNSAQLRGRAGSPVKCFAGFRLTHVRLTHVWSSSRNSNCRYSAGLASVKPFCLLVLQQSQED